MKSTSACSVLMIAPQGFGYNVQTASSNVYQKRISVSEKELVRKAVREWENLVHFLQKEGIEVITFDNIHDSLCPDAVFPNNWISLHPDGTIVLYPMMSENRRKERRDDIVEKISSLFDVKKTLDLTFLENKNVFLEGTGSVCFYHPGKLAFAAVSPRTNRDAFLLLCEKLQYEGVLFHTKGPDKCPVYHTNVVMNV